MLKYALPKLQSSASGLALPQLLAVSGARSNLECLVRAKLEEFGVGSVLGAQVAVLAGTEGEPGEWCCNVAMGQSGSGSAPLDEATLLPVLDAGVGVLVTCLLATV